MDGINRELFPIVEDKPYFNACSIGPLATPVKQAIEQQYIESWDQYGGISWVKEGGWNDTVEQARALFANIIGAKPEEIAYSFGNSVAFSSVMSALDFEKGDRVIFNELDFPSSPTNIMARAEYDIEYEVVAQEDGYVEASSYEKSINENTKLVTACEVASNTGARIDIEHLVELSHENDIPVFIDSYQSTGVIPTDVKQLDLDFLATGSLKWLVGGFGMSFLYIREDWVEQLNPSSIGWMGVDDPFEDLFDMLRTSLHRPSDATKFQYGTPYPIGAVSATAGMELIQDIGIDRIYHHDMGITEEIIELANDRDLIVQTPKEPEARGSIVNVKVEQAGSVVEQLQADGFILDMRSNGIRLAPHFYNNSVDIDKLFEAIDKYVN